MDKDTNIGRRPGGLGTVATLRNPDLVAAGASVDARE